MKQAKMRLCGVSRECDTPRFSFKTMHSVYIDYYNMTIQ